MTAPNGMDTRAVGRIVTLAMNHACWMNSLTWNGRLGSARMTSRARANSEPDCRRAPVRGAATSAHLTHELRRVRRGAVGAVGARRRLGRRDGGCLGGRLVAYRGHPGLVRQERAGRRGDAVGAAPLAGRALGATGRAVARAQLQGDRRQRRQLLPLLGSELVGVLLLRHADGPDRLRV